MPIQLLGKKSWNPYLPQNIARIKADEADAAEREEELDKLKDEYDANIRAAKLRGLPQPSKPERIDELEQVSAAGKRTRQGFEKNSSAETSRKRRRRLPGEDDTEHEIRVANEVQVNSEEARKRLKKDTRPITDHSGHVQLFASHERKGGDSSFKNEEAEKERKKKERELEDQYKMRLTNAAGPRRSANDLPWYAGSLNAGGSQLPGRNVFGDEDQGRHKRDALRLHASDPMSAMKAAQGKLKESSHLKQVKAHKDDLERRKWQLEEQNLDDKRKDRHHRSRHSHEHRKKRPRHHERRH